MSDYQYLVEVFWVEEDEAWFATSPIFGPGVSAFGDTPDEAVAEFRTALELAIETYRERGIPLPQDFSGKLNLRMPRSLHAQLSRQAAAEGVSLNMLMIAYLAERSGRTRG